MYCISTFQAETQKLEFLLCMDLPSWSYLFLTKIILIQNLEKITQIGNYHFT
jgi:hypothetical protein